VVTAGLPLREVRLFSIPKLNLYAVLVQEQRMQDALLQAAAVWAPDKVSDQLSVISNQPGKGGAQSGTPTSLEEWEAMTGLKIKAEG